MDQLRRIIIFAQTIFNFTFFFFFKSAAYNIFVTANHSEILLLGSGGVNKNSEPRLIFSNILLDFYFYFGSLTSQIKTGV